MLSNLCCFCSRRFSNHNLIKAMRGRCCLGAGAPSAAAAQDGACGGHLAPNGGDNLVNGGRPGGGEAAEEQQAVQ